MEKCSSTNFWPRIILSCFFVAFFLFVSDRFILAHPPQCVRGLWYCAWQDPAVSEKGGWCGNLWSTKLELNRLINVATSTSSEQEETCKKKHLNHPPTTWSLLLCKIWAFHQMIFLFSFSTLWCFAFCVVFFFRNVCCCCCLFFFSIPSILVSHTTQWAWVNYHCFVLWEWLDLNCDLQDSTSHILSTEFSNPMSTPPSLQCSPLSDFCRLGGARS